MHKGKSLTELAQELTDRQTRKSDFIVDTQELYMAPDAQALMAQRNNSTLATSTTDHAHGQIATWAGIPKKYYDKAMASDPALLALNVNHWFRNQDKTVKRMVRTMDGTFRAFLSDSYRRVDNEQVAQAALEPVLRMQGHDELRVLSCDVTDRKLYIQAAFPKLEGEPKVGDPVQAGVIISNSEIGAGALEVRPILYRLACMNGMVIPRDIDTDQLRRSHVGRRVEATEDYSIYRDETLEADDRALMLKIRDTIEALTDRSKFDRVIAEMRRAAESDPVKNPHKAVEEVTELLQLPDTRQGPILEQLIRDGDYSQWGMANAITAQAHGVEDYDEAVEFEQLGGRIITLDPAAWSRVAEAA